MNVIMWHWQVLSHVLDKCHWVLTRQAQCSSHSSHLFLLVICPSIQDETRVVVCLRWDKCHHSSETTLRCLVLSESLELSSISCHACHWRCICGPFSHMQTPVLSSYANASWRRLLVCTRRVQPQEKMHLSAREWEHHSMAHNPSTTIFPSHSCAHCHGCHGCGGCG
jgi:hypothetical protein